MRTPLELIVAATVLVLWPLFDHFVWWPRWRRRLVAGGPGVRFAVYRVIALVQWVLVALTVAALVLGRRSPADLGLVARPGWRLWAGLGACAALAWLSTTQALAVRASERLRERVRGQLTKVGDAIHVLPRTPGELAGFFGISLTAGICEEFLFRGFAIWLLSAWMPAPLAALVSCASFGLAHSYQGPTGAIRSGLLGVVIAALYLGSGSLIPAMIFHALIDVGSGVTTYYALSQSAAAAGPAPPGSPATP